MEAFWQHTAFVLQALVDSWLTRNNSTVYQLMETDDPALLALWQIYWDDLVAFEVHPLRDKPD